ncbi:MAG TPA: sensor domain-containing diguanylate cyclase, partial [Anaerolinea sp.]|nr:sensor domain-containing diguanylate cyclase [Anaerolinea sp.]
RRTVIIEDYATWEGRSPKFDPVHRTVICVPLMYNQELLGAISVGADPDLKKFDLRDIRMIEMFSQQAAIAIHNARLFSEVQRLAVTDVLTGIYNRRAFFDRARQEYNRSVRYGHRISVIMLDVDHFKGINDRFGHAAGDETLRTIANLCTSNLRSCDILGRYGGEEFTILVPETPLNGALTIAQRLCDQIAAISISSERGVIRVTASIGVAEMSEEISGLDDLIDRADQALYRAKQSGRNRVAI